MAGAQANQSSKVLAPDVFCCGGTGGTHATYDGAQGE